MDTILKRRSIRKFTDQPVPEADINDLLKAAMSAPSAGNAQPWHFIIIEDRELLNYIPRIHNYAHMVPEAAGAILVVGKTSLEKFEGYWVQDCAAATQNILLAAQSRGLGAVWLGIHPHQKRKEQFRELFKLPADAEPLSLVAFGHPAENKPPANRFKKTRIHHNQW